MAKCHSERKTKYEIRKDVRRCVCVRALFDCDPRAYEEVQPATVNALHVNCGCRVFVKKKYTFFMGISSVTDFVY